MDPESLVRYSFGISAVAIIVSVVAIINNKQIAKKYGDVAATVMELKHWQEQAAIARRVALQALRNEVDRIQALVSINQNLLDESESPKRPPVKVPTIAFETAFFSRESNLLASGEGCPASQLLPSVIPFLAKADLINSDVEYFFTHAVPPAGHNWTKDQIRGVIRIHEESLEAALLLETMKEELSKLLSDK